MPFGSRTAGRKGESFVANLAIESPLVYRGEADATAHE